MTGACSGGVSRTERTPAFNNRRVGRGSRLDATTKGRLGGDEEEVREGPETNSRLASLTSLISSPSHTSYD